MRKTTMSDKKKLQKTEKIENRIEEENDLPVYDAEIIDEEEDNTKIKLRDAKSPVGKLAYKLGKAAGSIIASLVLFNEIRSAFKTKVPIGGDFGRGMGKGRRRRKGKMRRII